MYPKSLQQEIYSYVTKEFATVDLLIFTQKVCTNRFTHLHPQNGTTQFSWASSGRFSIFPSLCLGTSDRWRRFPLGQVRTKWQMKFCTLPLPLFTHNGHTAGTQQSAALPSFLPSSFLIISISTLLPCRVGGGDRSKSKLYLFFMSGSFMQTHN